MSFIVDQHFGPVCEFFISQPAPDSFPLFCKLRKRTVKVLHGSEKLALNGFLVFCFSAEKPPFGTYASKIAAVQESETVFFSTSCKKAGKRPCGAGW